jgi:hypothetical protein
MEYELSKPSERICNAARILESLSGEDTVHVGKAGNHPIFGPG